MIRPRLRTSRIGALSIRQGLALVNGSASSSTTSNIIRNASRRSLHSVPTLRHDFSETGVPNLMSPAGFSIAWTDYMTLATEKLNALTAGTVLEDKDTKTISLLTAREPNQAPIFNWASMAHNTHFFFDGITPDPQPIPDELRRDLEASFSSMETLRREFAVTAAAMFGPGFLWLVRAGPADYRILPTYLAGSPYPGAHWRAQNADLNTLGADGSAKSHLRSQVFGRDRRRGAAAAGPQQQQFGDLPPGGIELEPLLCLNTWEHSWLLDWGVGKGGAGGKVAYAESWWEQIDWEVVAKKAGIVENGLKIPGSVRATI